MTKLVLMAGLALALCGCTERAPQSPHRASPAASAQPDIELVLDVAPR